MKTEKYGNGGGEYSRGRKIGTWSNHFPAHYGGWDRLLWNVKGKKGEGLMAMMSRQHLAFLHTCLYLLSLSLLSFILLDMFTFCFFFFQVLILKSSYFLHRALCFQRICVNWL